MTPHQRVSLDRLPADGKPTRYRLTAWFDGDGEMESAAILLIRRMESMPPPAPTQPELPFGGSP